MKRINIEALPIGMSVYNQYNTIRITKTAKTIAKNAKTYFIKLFFTFSSIN